MKLKKYTYADGDGNGTSPPPPPPPPPVMFTQDQVNKLLADDKRKLKEQNAEMVRQLEEIKQSATLTKQQKDDLEQRIEALSQQHMTKEQQLAADLEKSTKKAKADLEAKESEAKSWRTQFENTRIENALLDGASQHKAANAKQMQKMFGSQAKVVEVLDDSGAPTGAYKVVLPVETVDPKTKKTTITEFEAVEAIGKLRENPDYANLFLFDGQPGIGGSNDRRTKQTTADVAQMSPEDYRKFRKEQGYNK